MTPTAPMLQMTYTLADLPEVATKILQTFPDTRVFLLEGELGAGKTTLIQSIAKALGYAGEVTSPTFGLVNEYCSPAGKLYHMDLYRLSSVDEAHEAGILDVLDSGHYCFVEWPSVLAAAFDADCVQISIASNETDTRILTATMYI